MPKAKKPNTSAKKQKSILSGFVPLFKTSSKTSKKAPKKTAKKPSLKKDPAEISQSIQKHSKKQFQEFIDFIRDQGIVGLAIGFVMGTQAKVLVDAMSTGFITPIVGLLLPGSGSLQGRTFTLHTFSQTAVFAWGDFVWALINFLILAFVIFFTFKMLKLDKLDKPKK